MMNSFWPLMDNIFICLKPPSCETCSVDTNFSAGLPASVAGNTLLKTCDDTCFEIDNNAVAFRLEDDANCVLFKFRTKSHINKFGKTGLPYVNF